MGTAYPKPPTPVSKTLAKSKTNGILNTKELTMAEVMEIISIRSVQQTVKTEGERHNKIVQTECLDVGNTYTYNIRFRFECQKNGFGKYLYKSEYDNAYGKDMAIAVQRVLDALSYSPAPIF